MDSLYPIAVDILRQHRQSTDEAVIAQPVSLLQRKLLLGYDRTLALVDDLERLGILSRLNDGSVIIKID